MNLKVQDRLILLSLMPGEGNIATLRIVRDLRRDLGFDEDETAALGLNVDPDSGNVRWEAEADVGKDVSVGPVARELIRAKVDELSEAGSLKIEYLDLYERFTAEPQHADDSEAI